MDKSQVNKIISRIMGVSSSEVTEETSPDNLPQWDSLKHIHLILAIEEEFGVQFTDQEIVSIKGVKSIVLLLTKKLGG